MESYFPMLTFIKTNENIWFDGFSHTYFSRDAINKNVKDDTLSNRNISNGYNIRSKYSCESN